MRILGRFGKPTALEVSPRLHILGGAVKPGSA
jgi:hypothetical protein